MQLAPFERQLDPDLAFAINLNIINSINSGSPHWRYTGEVAERVKTLASYHLGNDPIRPELVEEAAKWLHYVWSHRIDTHEGNAVCVAAKQVIEYIASRHRIPITVPSNTAPTLRLVA